MTESRVVLPQPLGPTSSVSSPERHLEVDAAQRLDPGLARAEDLGHAAAGHREVGTRCGRWSLHSKHRRRLEHQDAPDAHETRQRR